MDRDQAVELVREDVERGVGRWLPADSPLEIGVSGELSDAAFTAVQWVHRGRNAGAGSDPFIGLAPTGTEVEVHGVTLIEEIDGGPVLFRRYVDWVGVFDQLGLAVNGRLAVSEHPGHIG